MEQINSTAFRRSISFTRSSKRNGLFSWPVVTFNMQEQGGELGTLVLQGRKATYTSVAMPADSFRLKKNLWASSWIYDDGDGGREFGRYTTSWNFKTTFKLSSGEQFGIKAKRRWLFSAKRAGEATQSATFFRDNMPVLLLQSFVPTRIFFNEVTALLEGTLATDLADMRVITGLLIFYQTFLEARNRSAH